jgi:hypothetical protein
MTTEVVSYLPVNHVFVDFENLKTIDGDTLGKKNFTFHLILGPTNKTLPVEAVARMMESAQTVTLIRSPKSGKNAADFVLAFYLGQAAAADPTGYFHILSADEGFDSLVELLRSRKMKVKRHGTWDELKALIEPRHAAVQAPAATPEKVVPPVPVAKPAPPVVAAKSALSAGAAKLLEALTKSPKNRPKKQKTLVSHAKSSLGKSATDKQGEAVVEELRKAKKLTIDEKGAVTYRI